jgi:biopolymer transport protein ExbD
LADGEVLCAQCEARLEAPRPTDEPSQKEPVANPVGVHLRPDKPICDGEMDMTPMVDVVFNLLIFFMVTASFSLEKAMTVPAPKTDQPSSNPVQQVVEEETDTITVRVDSHNTFRVICPEFDEEAPSEQELLSKLRAARASSPSANKLMVIAHGDARNDKVVAAMDAGMTVGMDGIKLATVEEDEY